MATPQRGGLSPGGRSVRTPATTGSSLETYATREAEAVHESYRAQGEARILPLRRAFCLFYPVALCVLVFVVLEVIKRMGPGPPAPAPAPTSVFLGRVNVSGVDPLAVCNDGTTGSYYFAPATTNSSMWVVDLMGGFWCWSDESCAARCAETPWYCSSDLYPSYIEVAGLFLDDALKGANRLYIGYCSSDGWLGDAESFGRQFRGNRIVSAVLKDLVTTHGLAMSAERKDTVVFGGQSAGGRGAVMHLDYVKEMIALGGGTQEVDVVGLLDSPLWLDAPNFEGNNGGDASLTNQTMMAFEYLNAQHVGEACAAAYLGDEAWKCTFSQYRLQHTTTPYLLILPLFDSWQLEWRVTRKPETTEEIAYAVDFAAQNAALLRQLRADWPPGAAMQNAILAWSCYDHASSISNWGWFEQSSHGRTASSAFRIFLGLEPQGDGQPPLEWVEACEGFVCGAGCKVPSRRQPAAPLLK